MFEGFKVLLARNQVIIGLLRDSVLEKSKGDLMCEIAGNSANVQYGAGLLQKDLVKCKYTAAAAVFARLAVLYAKNPCNGLTDQDWKFACARALILAGATTEEAVIVMQEFLDMNERVEGEALFPT